MGTNLKNIFFIAKIHIESLEQKIVKAHCKGDPNSTSSSFEKLKVQ